MEVYCVTSSAVYAAVYDRDHRTCNATLLPPSRPLRRLVETDERARPYQFDVKLGRMRETAGRARPTSGQVTP